MNLRGQQHTSPLTNPLVLSHFQGERVYKRYDQLNLGMAPPDVLQANTMVFYEYPNQRQIIPYHKKNFLLTWLDEFVMVYQKIPGYTDAPEILTF